YKSIDVEFDIDLSSSSSNLNSTIQSSSTIWHSNAIHTRSLNVLPTVVDFVKKRNIEESNIETHNNNGKRIKASSNHSRILPNINEK
ncbi:hypothetical protein C1645_830640, partial [Glomus cerebriforme]